MLLIRFIYWKIKDLISGFKNRKNEKIHLYGIYGYFGLPGYGKTMAMSWELLELRKKYKDKIYIFTNYGFKEEDRPFDNWRMLLETYDKPAIFAWETISFVLRKFSSILSTVALGKRFGNSSRFSGHAPRKR